MRLWPFSKRKEMTPVHNAGWRIIHEPFAGAWQQNAPLTLADKTTYPTLYACLNRIASDIGKLPYRVMTQNDGVWERVHEQVYGPVLARPNDYQTQQQFRESWLLSKLMHGNTYLLKARGARGNVVALHALNPHTVTPLVSDSGAVYYRLRPDAGKSLADVNDEITIPAREIIHDRMHTIYHPLVGIPPLTAAALAAGKNLRILRSSEEFFANGAQPGGLITAPAGMSEKDSDSVEKYWQANFSGENRGRIAVIGADMKFTPFAFKAADSQLVEQMRYSDEQICQPFGIPPYKVGIGSLPAGLKVDDLNQLYYADALQQHIEAMEYLLDDGLGVPPRLHVALDLEPLLRMDVGKQAEVESKLVGKIKTPDEARRVFGLPSTGGGDTLWGQHQDYPLGVLAERNDLAPRPDDRATERAIAALMGV